LLSHAPPTTALGDKCAEGVYRCILFLESNFKEDTEPPLALEKMGIDHAAFMKFSFREACRDCASLLLPYASYSTSLVSLLHQDEKPEISMPQLDGESARTYLKVIQVL
jgi:hypothetical protein